MKQVRAETLCSSRAGGLITWTRVGGGSGNWAWAFGSIRTFHDKPTPFQDMTAARRFSGPALEELAKAKILGVRAGAEHRYTGVWVVVKASEKWVRGFAEPGRAATTLELLPVPPSPAPEAEYARS